MSEQSGRIEAEMNKLDRRIERLAFELFTAQGFHPATVQAKIQELKICTDRGYNSRSEILALLKMATGQAA